jgi:hypothetical protein
MCWHTTFSLSYFYLKKESMRRKILWNNHTTYKQQFYCIAILSASPFLFLNFNFFIYFVYTYASYSYFQVFIFIYRQGRIHDLWLGGGGVSRRGVWDRLRFPAGPWQSPGRGPRRAKPSGNSGGLRNYRHLFERQFWTNHTIFIRPKQLDFES